MKRPSGLRFRYSDLAGTLFEGSGNETPRQGTVKPTFAKPQLFYKRLIEGVRQSTVPKVSGEKKRGCETADPARQRKYG